MTDTDDIKTHWQSLLRTKEKKEPADSYEILKLKMKYPGITHHEISEITGYDETRIKELSTRYFHASRVQAFNEYQMRRLAPQIIDITSNGLKIQKDNLQKRKTLANNHENIVGKLQQMYGEEVITNNRVPSQELSKEYTTQYHRLDQHYEIESRTNLNNAKIIEILANEEKNKPENRTAVNTFIKSIHNIREEDTKDE